MNAPAGCSDPGRSFASTLPSRLLLAAGGALIVAGSFAPELRVAVANAFGADPPRRMPERSHWVVFRENVDMFSDPDLSLGAWYYIFWAVEAAGLAYLVVAGAALAASSAFRRCRVAASGFLAVHSISLLALSAGALVVVLGSPEGGLSARTSRYLLLAAAALGALLAAELAWGALALRRGRVAGFGPVDASNLVPAAFLLVANGALFVALRAHPNWPAAGYLVGAIGALLAVCGMALRREPA